MVECQPSNRTEAAAQIPYNKALSTLMPKICKALLQPSGHPCDTCRARAWHPYGHWLVV